VTATRRDPHPQRYQIRVRGRLGETIRSAFPGLQARTRGGDTVLTGVLADQAALYGVLAEIEALSLELIEVRRLPPHLAKGAIIMRPSGVISELADGTGPGA
jgi:hypothetical protein